MCSDPDSPGTAAGRVVGRRWATSAREMRGGSCGEVRRTQSEQHPECVQTHRRERKRRHRQRGPTDGHSGGREPRGGRCSAGLAMFRTGSARRMRTARLDRGGRHRDVDPGSQRRLGQEHHAQRCWRSGRARQLAGTGRIERSEANYTARTPWRTAPLGRLGRGTERARPQ